MLLPHGTVIALVDGNNFQLFRNAGNEATPELDPLPSPKLDAHNHSGTGHHSSAGNHAGTLVSEDAHAIAAVNWLNAQVLGHKIDNLVLIAAPRTLGEMRRHYHKQLEQVLMGELAKDLAGRKGPEILAALKGR
ncbi:host attachment protein [Novosphingobium bradum]|uniref:Host attachment protein n=1 Tax=Novosphingobium bradum TaxID=1737444 RepID=A0ABV7IL22_9SPHN